MKWSALLLLIYPLVALSAVLYLMSEAVAYLGTMP